MLNKFLKGKDSADFVFLMFANFGILPVTLFTNIILTNVLGVFQFGNYIYLISLIGLFTTIFTFGFFQAGGRAILLSSNITRKSSYYGAVLIISLVLYLFLSIFLFIYLYFDTNIKAKELNGYVYILILSGWVMLLKRYYDVLFQSDKKTKLLAFSRVFQPILFLASISVLYFGLNKDLSLYALLVLFVITHLVAAIFILYKLKPKFLFISNRFREILLYNKKFGFHLYIGSILPLSLAGLSAIFISYVSEDNAGVGFYFLALSLVSLLSIVPNTIATVLYKSFSKELKIPHNVVKYTIALTLIKFIFLLILIKPFINFFYDDGYEPVIYLVYIMGAGLVAHGMADFYNRYLSANGFGIQIKNSAILTGFFSLISSVVLISLYQEKGAAISTLLTGFFYFALIFSYYMKITKNLR